MNDRGYTPIRFRLGRVCAERDCRTFIYASWSNGKRKPVPEGSKCASCSAWEADRLGR